VDLFLPATVKQAKWMIVGGVFIVGLGVARAATFFRHGGLMFLLLGVLFVSVGIATVVGSVTLLRRGDPPPADSAETSVHEGE
jgi:hypothetical protein